MWLKSICLLFMGLGVWGGPSLALAQTKPAVQAFEYCSKCHERLNELGRPVAEWRGSVHERHGVFCQDCHGGDPTTSVLPEAKASQRGFTNAPKPAQEADFCAPCHQEGVASYLNSTHGILVDVGEGPSCVRCHNSHDVQEVSLDLITVSACSPCHKEKDIRGTQLVLGKLYRRIKRLEGQIARLSANYPGAVGIQKKFQKTRKDFTKLAHFLNLDVIRQQQVAVEEQVAILEFMVRFPTIPLR